MSSAELPKQPIHCLHWWTSGKPVGAQVAGVPVRSEADIVIELAPSDHEDEMADHPYRPSSDHTSMHLEDEPPSIVEQDLSVQEFFSEDEGDVGKTPPMLKVSGRNLMATKTQRCMVCLANKPHTLVPPHRNLEVSQPSDTATSSDSAFVRAFRRLRGQQVEQQSQALVVSSSIPRLERRQVESHCFCTDCWAEYLSHNAERFTIHNKQELTCPICREVIDIPDAWAVNLGIPEALRRDVAPPPAARPLWSRQPCFWARRRRISEELAEQQDPILGGGPARGRAWCRCRCGPRTRQCLSLTMLVVLVLSVVIAVAVFVALHHPGAPPAKRAANKSTFTIGRSADVKAQEKQASALSLAFS